MTGAAAIAAGVVLAASGTAQVTRRVIAAPTDTATIRHEIDDLNTAMIAAIRRDPATVAAYYADDAKIIGGGERATGREEVNRYWASSPPVSDWQLEILEIGGDAASPWYLGRSTLTAQSGRTMVTEFLVVLRRDPQGALRIYIDFYTAAGPPRPAGQEPR